MTKSKAAKRKRDVQVDARISKLSKSSTLPTTITTASSTITPPPDDDWEPKQLHTLVDEFELETTIDTLTTLAKYPSVLKSKACRELRGVVYEFRQACTTGVNTAADTNLTARITAALTDGKYTDARILLAEMRIRGESPKLGALCRWVRDLDVVSGLSMHFDGVSHIHTSVTRTEKEKELLCVLDAVLRVTGPTDTNPGTLSESIDPIAVQQVWNLRDGAVSEEVYRSVLDESIFTSLPSNMNDQFRIIETTPGPLRKPPNHHPAILYTCKDNTISLPPLQKPASYHSHPTVPNLGLIKNVLSPQECKSIIAAAERTTFVPDAPVRSDGEEASILAHNFYWVVDTAFHDNLWARVSAHVPTHVGGRKVRGLNRRFRVYRYVPGAEYRCHIDGAWPPSGITPDDGYVYDASPAGAKQSSLFTFLIYLNDEFEAGETTFFVPGVRDGVMNAYPVKPVMGAVAVFPHGEAKGALLHEGTGVRKGAKYVIRTDVEYDVDVGLE